MGKKKGPTKRKGKVGQSTTDERKVGRKTSRRRRAGNKEATASGKKKSITMPKRE